MSTHVAIVADLANTHNDSAFLDFVSDNAVTVRYVIGNMQFDVALNSNRFATSPDVFALGVPLPATVLAFPIANGQPVAADSRAALRQKKIVITAPSVEKIQGTQFILPLGDTGTGAQLLITVPPGNSTALVDVFAPPNIRVATQVGVEATKVVPVPLPALATMIEVRVASTNLVPLIVQLAVAGHGQDFTQTYAEPIA